MIHPTTYRTWVEMRRRCRATNRQNSPYYSDLGISVCERWNSFELFFEDMGERPEGMTLDRINNEKGYEPENCRWATPETQANNRNVVRMVPLGGVLVPLAQACRQTGISYTAAAQRFNAGWPIEKVLAEPGARAKRKGRNIGSRIRELCEIIERLGPCSPSFVAAHTDMHVHRYLYRAKSYGLVFSPTRGICKVSPDWRIRIEDKNLPLWREA